MIQADTYSAAPAQISFPRSLLTWLRLINKWRKLILVATAAVLVSAVLAVILMPDRYTASAVILPPQQGSSAGASMMAQLSSMGMMGSAANSLGIKNPNDQQVALLRSRVVEEAMVARFNLQSLYRAKYVSTARKKWQKMTATDNGLKDGLIRISVTDRDPRRAARMANAWIEEYKRFTATIAITEASQRRLFFEQQLGAAREDLTRAEDDLKQTEQRTGVIDLEGQGRSMIASAAIIRGQLAAKQIEIRGMRQFASDGNPDLQRALQEAAGMEAQLASMDASADRQSGDLVAPKGKVTQAALEYARALREVKYRETIQELLLRQYESARVDEARQGALIQIVEPAVDPDRPDSRYKFWILLAALLLSLPFAVLTAAVTELVIILRRTRQRAGAWMPALEEVIGTW